jgi:hypothetical protein
VQPTAAELACSPDVVLPEGIAAIDDDIAFLQKAGKLLDGCLSNGTGRQHDPDNPWRPQFCDKIFKAHRPRGAFPCETSDGFWIVVIHNGRVFGSHEAADYVAAHPAKANHSQLHAQSPATIESSNSILLCRTNL